MEYSRQDFNHDKNPKIGVLITNLGTPDQPTAPALRRYLKQFLSDPRVVEFPRLLWWFMLRVILQIRPRRSAKSYAGVWTSKGSPLAIHTEAQAKLLAKHLGEECLVEWAMRYGQPSIAEKTTALLDKGVRKLLVLPLYPQYSATTTASTFDALADDFKSRRWIPALRFVDGYHNHPAYIQALCNSIRQHWEVHGRAEKLLFSYHGIPSRYLLNGDPYHCHCLNTTRLVVEQLGLASDDYLSAFQSRFGREEWLKPYTDFSLKSLAAEGVKHLQLICPGFSADCLETLEEIDVENRQYFLESGGEKFEYIPALNSCKEHILCLGEIIKDNLQGWESPAQDINLQARLAQELKEKQL